MPHRQGGRLGVFICLADEALTRRVYILAADLEEIILFAQRHYAVKLSGELRVGI